MHETIPLDDPEHLMRDILPLSLSSLEYLPPVAAAVTGTGFILGDGVLATCWHCIGPEPPDRHWYGATRLRRGENPTSPIGFKEQLATDVAWARVNFRATLGFRLASKTPKMGDPVWTFGYPLSERRRHESGVPLHTLHPRVLRGHIMREFVFPHPKLGNMPSWELSFPAPEGLSGAPLFIDGSLEVVGMIHGSNDVGIVEQHVTVDPETGKRTPEVQRIVTFGLAHHLSVLRSLADKAATITDAQYVPD